MRRRDLVRQSLEFASPPAVPRQAWVLPWAEERYPEEVTRLRTEFPDDIVTSPGLYLRPLPVVGQRYQKGLYVDEWGCRFDNVHGGVIGIVREPLIREWSDLERFETPACTLAIDRGAVNAFCRSTDQFVLAGTLVRPFERLCFLRTMEGALVDLFTRPPGFMDLFERLHHHYLAEVEAWAATDVDAIVLMDDWGAQDRMLVSPAIWRELYKPIYRRSCDVARRAGKFVFMHSDGWIVDILPDLIEVGVHAINSQVACMGAEALESVPRTDYLLGGDRPAGGPVVWIARGRQARGRRREAVPLRQRRCHRPVRVRTRRPSGKRARGVQLLAGVRWREVRHARRQHTHCGGRSRGRGRCRAPEPRCTIGSVGRIGNGAEAPGEGQTGRGSTNGRGAGHRRHARRLPGLRPRIG